MDSDAFRLDEWHALPKGCGINGCDDPDDDARGPLFMRDGSMHRLCTTHWEAVFRILGEQATWTADAHHHAVDSGT